MSTSSDIAGVRRAKEVALEAGDMVEVVRLRAVEKNLLEQQAKEFKPNSRGS